MAKKYYFDYVSVPGLFKNSLAEADAVGGAFLECVFHTLKEYGIHIDSARVYDGASQVYKGSNRFGGFIAYYGQDSFLVPYEKTVKVWLTQDNKLLVDFYRDPLISENTNDEIVEDIKKEAVKCGLLNEDSQIYVSDVSNASGSGGCYVATAVYGSYDCPEVWVLRRFRDILLMKTWYGRVFVKAYYEISPFLVNKFGNMLWFQRFWKCRLDKLIFYLKLKGFEDSPYKDR